MNFNKNNFDITNPRELALDIQNYMMNFETVLLNEGSYDFSQPGTVSEKVFWHWMLKHGLRLEETYSGSGIYREEHHGAADQNRIIQCFGQVDAGNSLSTEFGMFNETYVSVPTSYGNGPVFFRKSDSYEDSNFRANTSYPTMDDGGPVIQGRSKTDYSYLGDVNARYDSGEKYVTNLHSDGVEVVKDFTTMSYALQKLQGGEGVTVKSWDDVNIDQLVQFRNIEGGVYDMSNGDEFNFNAILLYYSVYDLDDVYKQPLATNLFGIVFLDGGSGNGDYVLAPVKKKKSFMGQTGRQAYFGNSYSFRVNIKTLSVYDNTDSRIDDMTTGNSLYVKDFNDVISTLNRAVDMMNFNSHTVNAIQDRYMALQAAQAELTNVVNTLPADVLAKTLSVMDVSIAAEDSSMRTYVDDQIDQLKERLGLVDSSVEVLGLDDSELDTTSNVLGLGAKSTRRTYSLGETTRNARRPAAEVDIDEIVSRTIDALDERNANIFEEEENPVTPEVNIDDIVSKTLDALSAQNNNKEEKPEINVDEMVDEIVSRVVETIDARSAERSASEQPAEVDVTTVVNERVAQALDMFGVMLMDGISTLNKKSEKPGRYLIKGQKSKITTWADWDGENWSEAQKCEKGRLYSVNGLMYKFNGTTCVLLGD